MNIIEYIEIIGANIFIVSVKKDDTFEYHAMLQQGIRKFAFNTAKISEILDREIKIKIREKNSEVQEILLQDINKEYDAECIKGVGLDPNSALKDLAINVQHKKFFFATKAQSYNNKSSVIFVTPLLTL
jgi:hypothetical protein